MRNASLDPYLEGDLILAFRHALESLPNLSVKDVRNNVRLRTGSRQIEVDAIIQIEANGKTATLVIEAKRSVFPRDAREIAWQLRGVQQALRDEEGIDALLPVIVSKSLSEGAKGLSSLSEHRLLRGGGSLSLIGPDLYILLTN